MSEHAPQGWRAEGFPGGWSERGQSCQGEGGRQNLDWHIKAAKSCRMKKGDAEASHLMACCCIHQGQHANPPPDLLPQKKQLEIKEFDSLTASSNQSQPND